MNIILPDNSKKIIDTGARTIEQVLIALDINPIEVIVSVNGRLVPEDAVATENDEIRIIRVAHGG
jgi:sulfur carrier protein ThiS